MNIKRCFVFDIDGTICLGDIPIQPTVDFIRRLWGRIDFYFLSNNTSKSPATTMHKLHAMGIPTKQDHILSPVFPLVHYLRKNNITTLYPVANQDFMRTLQQAMPGIHYGEEGCQAVVLAYDTELTYHKLARSALLLQQPEVAFLATHPDLVCPTPEGPIPDVGSFIALYRTATGRDPQQIFGKPETAVLEPLLAKYAKKEMVMVGDRLSTDKALAENAGIDFLLVLSGEATRQDIATLEHPPTLTLAHLGELAGY